MAPAAVRSVHIPQHNSSSSISTLKSHRARAHRKTMRSIGWKEWRKFIPFPNSIPLWYHLHNLLNPESTYCFTIFYSSQFSIVLPTIISLYVESIVNRTPCIQDTFSVSNIQESASGIEAALHGFRVLCFTFPEIVHLKLIIQSLTFLLSTHTVHTRYLWPRNGRCSGSVGR